MAKVRIIDLAPVTGEYELDLSYFTNRELHTIKTLSGVRAGELESALESLDNDLVVSLAKVALERNGKGNVPADVLWDARVGQIILDVTDEQAPEVEARPPVSQTESGNGSGSGVPSYAEGI